MAELLDVLTRDKFASRLALAALSPQDTVRELRRMAYMCAPTIVPQVIVSDPDDDHVLACALLAQADMIVSGDKHLHSLGGQYQGVRIVNAAEALRIISPRQG